MQATVSCPLNQNWRNHQSHPRKRISACHQRKKGKKDRAPRAQATVLFQCLSCHVQWWRLRNRISACHHSHWCKHAWGKTKASAGKSSNQSSFYYPLSPSDSPRSTCTWVSVQSTQEQVFCLTPQLRVQGKMRCKTAVTIHQVASTQPSGVRTSNKSDNHWTEQCM